MSNVSSKRKKKSSLSGDSGGRLANLVIKSFQSMEDNRECKMVWIVMNNTSLGL